jgi:hypothetical protein
MRVKAKIGTDVIYGPFVEGIAIPRNRRSYKSTPYLRPAFDTQKTKAKKEILDTLKAQIRSAVG